jgi:hypothetical protein
MVHYSLCNCVHGPYVMRLLSHVKTPVDMKSTPISYVNEQLITLFFPSIFSLKKHFLHTIICIHIYTVCMSHVAPTESYKKKKNLSCYEILSQFSSFLFSAYKAIITSVISQCNGYSLSHSLGHPHKNMNKFTTAKSLNCGCRFMLT